MRSARLRNTDLRVNLGALKHNLKVQREALMPGSRIFAVVKANAYGNGLVPVAQTLAGVGADGFCVALLDEALELRDNGIEKMVLVLGITPVAYGPLAANNGISLTVGDVAWLEEYRQLARDQRLTTPLRVHLGVDTGMGRIGFQDPAALKEALAVLKDPCFDFEGIFTHFATADEADTTYFDRQLTKWHEFLAALGDDRPKYVHMANSAIGMWHQSKITADTVRMGISLYGANPSGTILKPTLNIKPVTSLTSALSYVKLLPAGASVSYGATYTAKEDEWVGTVPLGYADGYPRRMQGFSVLVNGHRCEIIGRVCMDQFMIRMPKEFPVGTQVTLIGKDGDDEITVTDVAEYAGTINYEILTGMSDRLHRRYYN